MNEPKPPFPKWPCETIESMAEIGEAFMDALPAGYSWCQSPSEIIADLQNAADDRDFAQRKKLASMCETVMRCVFTVEGLPLVAVGESESVAQIVESCKKLRAAVMAATDGAGVDPPIDESGVAAMVEEFQKAMRDDVIPRIVTAINERNRAAAAARQVVFRAT